MCEREGCGETTKKKARRPLPCIACTKELSADHGGITCINGCGVCLDCSPSMVQSTFDEAKFPLRCPACKQPLVVQSFERQLTTDQLSLFLLYQMQTDEKYIASTEEIQSCPFCKYWHLSTKDPGRLMFFCQDSMNCGKVSCVWCKKEMKTRRLGPASFYAAADGDEEDTKEAVTDEQFRAHLICAEVGPLKAEWDEAIKQGSGTACPACGMVITKAADGACTHMTCSSCRTVFCYVCGESESACDKSKIRGLLRESIMQHQIDWKRNPKRCPMYLYELSRFDDRYARCTEQEILDRFHRLKTQQLLKECLARFEKKGVLRKLLSRYDLAATSGFDLDELSHDTFELIHRRDAAAAE